MPESRHVVVIVWDGMRPDFVTPENTPVLWKLAQEGVVFRNHHAAYLSATHVNGVAIVTGAYPNRSGLAANYDYRPEIDSKNFVSTERAEVIRKGDEVSGGNYLSVPTVPELVRAAGGHTVIAATKTIGLLLDRHCETSQAGALLSAGEAVPRELGAQLNAALGPFPKAHREQDVWTTKALTEFLWKDDLPMFSLLWLGEPDLTEHETCPGAPPALDAIRAADGHLAEVLLALEKKGASASTDIFVVSDHGFSTIERSIDLTKRLNEAGFHAMTEISGEPKRGDIMMVGNGGAVLFYVIGHDTTVTARLLKFLQQSDFAGVIFAAGKMAGAFDFAAAKIDRRDGPDLLMAFRWSDAKNQFGAPGMINGDWNRKAGKGTHATLGRFDMHNTLIAAGPDFRLGWKDDIPSGNVDLAPTILDILGVRAPPLDGRILQEAMIGKGDAVPEATTQTVEAKSVFPSGLWQQTLRSSRVGSTTYLDEGNGGFTPKK